MKNAVLLLMLAALPGCALDAFRGQVATRGAAAADDSLETAEFLACYAATVGSIRRRYGTSPERIQAWADYCGAETIGEVMR